MDLLLLKKFPFLGGDEWIESGKMFPESCFLAVLLIFCTRVSIAAKADFKNLFPLPLHRLSPTACFGGFEVEL